MDFKNIKLILVATFSILLSSFVRSEDYIEFNANKIIEVVDVFEKNKIKDKKLQNEILEKNAQYFKKILKEETGYVRRISKDQAFIILKNGNLFKTNLLNDNKQVDFIKIENNIYFYNNKEIRALINDLIKNQESNEPKTELKLIEECQECLKYFRH